MTHLGFKTEPYGYCPVPEKLTCEPEDDPGYGPEKVARPPQNSKSTKIGVAASVGGAFFFLAGCARPDVIQKCDDRDEGINKSSYSGPDETRKVGICRDLTNTCKNGIWEITQVEVLPKESEICNGLDDDCNGTTDEGFRQASYTGPIARIAVGICRAKVVECKDGKMTTTQEEVLPREAEGCNGLDDDCNGMTDEGLRQTSYTGRAGTAGVGICKTKIVECRNGGMTTTQQEVLPKAAEACNNLDDDCDGITDEGLTQTSYTGRAGSAGVGICKTKIVECRNGGMTTTQQEVLPRGTETCNNLDDDCNGATDEGLTQTSYAGRAGTAGVGICKTKIVECKNGSMTTTQEQVVPKFENYTNGEDDDCNGFIDDITIDGYSYVLSGDHYTSQYIRVINGGKLYFTSPTVSLSTLEFLIDSTSAVYINNVTCGTGNGSGGYGNLDGGGAAGGSHIGAGGNGGIAGYTGTGGLSSPAYGSLNQISIEPGSCGGTGGSEGGSGGRGGGALLIEGANIYLFGAISANGGNGANGRVDGGGGGGGSGGSILISGSRVTVDPSSTVLSASGGNGGNGGSGYAGGGGGGGGGGGSVKVITGENPADALNVIQRMTQAGRIYVQGGTGGEGLYPRLKGDNGQAGGVNTQMIP